MNMVNGSEASSEMPALLSIPLRQTLLEIEWTPALLRYIQTSYAEDASKYQLDSQTFDKLRRACFKNQTPELATLERFFA